MLEAIALVAALAVLARICWTDFFSLKIYNRDLLLLLGILLAFLAVARPDDIWLRFALGALLFIIAFIFWLLGKLGAGDAKLLGIAAALITPEQAMLFAILLMVLALLFHLLCRTAAVVKYLPAMAGRRVTELIDSGRVPYGIPIALATAALVIPRIAATL